MLLSLIPHTNVIHHYFYNKILYVITETNRYSKFWTKCRKDDAYKTLWNHVNAWFVEKRLLSLDEMSRFRYFQRNKQRKVLNIRLSREIYQILHRSKMVTHNLPSIDFYELELLLTDTESVGITFRCKTIGRKIMLEYISPIIV